VGSENVEVALTRTPGGDVRMSMEPKKNTDDSGSR
jgi:hypothetical protein